MSGQMSIRPRKVKQNRRNGVRYYDTLPKCRPSESWGPSPDRKARDTCGRWMPAFAGMTGIRVIRFAPTQRRPMRGSPMPCAAQIMAASSKAAVA
jgi:hypothetical protein